MKRGKFFAAFGGAILDLFPLAFVVNKVDDLAFEALRRFGVLGLYRVDMFNRIIV